VITKVKSVCIHQPDFAPYLGFFDRLLHTEHFILLDNVQFIRRGWQHRDRIKTRDGSGWLTLSLQKGDYHQRISDVRLAPDERWRIENLALLRQCYAKAPCFDLIYPQVEAIYRAGHERLIDFNMALLDMALRLLSIDVQMSFASAYPVASSGSQRLLELVLAVQGDNYLTGPGSRDYLDEALFAQSGVSVSWQNFKHPTYSQLYGNFEPMLSCLDLFFNCGNDAALVLRGLTRG
jgi:hypothetical protein